MTALRSDVGRPGAFTGGLDRSGGSTGDRGSGRLLSVAGLQQALQAARAASGDSATPIKAEAELHGEVDGWIDRGAAEVAPSTLVGAGPWPTADLGAIVVVGAHGGAGASTVAVALADAAAAQGRGVRLISRTPAAWCGLVAVSSVELGISRDGHWRRGRRGSRITVERLAGADMSTALPCFDDSGSLVLPLRIVDLGASGEQLPRSLVSAVGGAVVVVLVFRVTVPGVQHAEQVLGELQQRGSAGAGDGLVLLACVGPRRWPGVVTASVGPLLRQQRRDSQLIAVPIDRQLERTGLTSSELPNAVGKAAARLLGLIQHRGSLDCPSGRRGAPDSGPPSLVALHCAVATAGQESPDLTCTGGSKGTADVTSTVTSTGTATGTSTGTSGDICA